MSCEYVKDYYQVPACIGRSVIVDGKPGVITEDRGNHIGVTFEHEPGFVYNCHPTWKVEYGEMQPPANASSADNLNDALIEVDRIAERLTQALTPKIEVSK